MEKFSQLWEKLRKQEKADQGHTESYLIVGLGNPGKEYRLSRHNVGFMVIDKLSERQQMTLRKVQFKALVGDVRFGDTKIILAKPQTFMNLSGNAVSSLIRFYKLPLERVCIVHDDLDLPFGTIRMRASGGSGGQKGLASVIDKAGTKDFPRLRIGIGRPPGRMQSSNYVLKNFTPQQETDLEMILNHACDAILHYIEHGIDQAMTKFNGSIEND